MTGKLSALGIQTFNTILLEIKLGLLFVCVYGVCVCGVCGVCVCVWCVCVCVCV